MKVPYQNDTDSPVHIGNVTIMPGNTRDVEETHIPGHKGKEIATQDTQPHPLGDLLKGNVGVVAQALNGMAFEDVELLGELEQAGQARKTLLAAIATEILARQAGMHLTQVLDGTLDDIVAALPALSVEDLAKANDMEQVGQAREVVMNAIAAEQLKRAD